MKSDPARTGLSASIPPPESAELSGFRAAVSCALAGALLAASTAAPLAAIFLYLERLDLALGCYAAHWILNAGYNAPTYALMQALADARTRALAVATHLSIVNLVGLTSGPFVVGLLNDRLEPELGVQAIRYSLMLVCFSNAFASIFYMLGSRTVPQDVGRAPA